MMKSLAKRVDNLEHKAGKEFHIICVDNAEDGGVIHKGKYYKDTNALLTALGIKHGTVQIMYFAD